MIRTHLVSHKDAQKLKYLSNKAWLKVNTTPLITTKVLDTLSNKLFKYLRITNYTWKSNQSIIEKDKLRKLARNAKIQQQINNRYIRSKENKGTTLSL